MRVLGIETSCDETGLAVFDTDRGLLAHALHTQVALHAPYGGVVPELASRDHIRRIIPLVRQVFAESAMTGEAPDAVAYTAGPGLAGALLTGAAVASGLALAWGVPRLGVHHMEGHLLAPLLEPGPPAFPFVALLVSGGHTQLIAVRDFGHYTLLGDTRDDAAGEAFDKTAKLLGLSYPGGPALAQLARAGDPDRFRFPRPMTDRPGLEFSFSGLKTFAINALARAGEEQSADIAAAFEAAVVDTLRIKCRRALAATGMNRLVVAGGVGANRRLREVLTGAACSDGFEVYYPRMEFCTDNGAMIAHVGALRLAAGERDPVAFTVRPRWPLSELSAIAG